MRFQDDVARRFLEGVAKGESLLKCSNERVSLIRREVADRFRVIPRPGHFGDTIKEKKGVDPLSTPPLSTGIISLLYGAEAGT
jgi:hypothetical protein